MTDKAEFYNALRVNETLLELYDRMVGEVRLDDVLRTVAAVVCRSFHAERATIYLVDHERQELYSVALIGNVPHPIRVPIESQSLAGHCALTGECLAVPDVYGDLEAVRAGLRFDARWDKKHNFRTRDVLCAPCRFREELLGVVQLVNSKAEPFCEADLPPLQTVARLISYALYHARLYEDLATLKQLEREKARFMRVLVHELKSPVSAAKMLTELLRGQVKDNPPVADMTDRIDRRMDEMRHLVEDVLDLAKIKGGDPLGEVAVLDLTRRTADVCRKHQDAARAKGLDLTVDLADTPLPVRMDSRGCELVLSNLISNAVKYTETGRVHVRLAPADSHAELIVRDTGIGIPEDDIPKLFGEFFRASNAKASSIPGSGVGLAGAKSIIDRFSGQLLLDSQLGKGTTFTLRLPLHEAE